MKLFDPPLLTIPESAAELRISRRHFAKHLADGEIPYIKIGRSVRVSAADIRDFVEARKMRGHRPARSRSTKQVKRTAKAKAEPPQPALVASKNSETNAPAVAQAEQSPTPLKQ